MKLDTRGLKCPMPIVKVNKIVADVPAHEAIEVISDDAAFPPDIRAWCDQRGYTVESLDDSDSTAIKAVIRKKVG